MASRSGIDFNPSTNPLIDPLTLPRDNSGFAKLKVLFQSHPKELGPVVDLYLKHQPWTYGGTAINWTASLWGGDRKTHLIQKLTTDGDAEFTFGVKILLRMEIITAVASPQDMAKFSKLIPSQKEEIAEIFIMLAFEDRTAEAFGLILNNPNSRTELVNNLQNSDRSVRGVLLNYFLISDARTNVDFIRFIGTISNEILKEGIALLIHFYRSNLAIRITDRGYNLQSSPFTLLERVFSTLQEKDKNQNSFKDSIHLVNALSAKEWSNILETFELERVPLAKRPLAIGLVASLMNILDRDEGLAVPLAFRFVLVRYFSSLNTELYDVYSIIKILRIDNLAFIRLNNIANLCKQIENNELNINLFDFLSKLVIDAQTLLMPPSFYVNCAKAWEKDTSKKAVDILNEELARQNSI